MSAFHLEGRFKDGYLYSLSDIGINHSKRIGHFAIGAPLQPDSGPHYRRKNANDRRLQAPRNKIVWLT